jgi:ergothioneine biosynthesis protein EgtB
MNSTGTYSSRTLAEAYSRTRSETEKLCETLATEDYVVQSMPDVSPTKWHLAHTSWFFETFVLAEAVDGYEPFHPEFAVLFNSYYNAVGEQFSRPDRGLLSRPTVKEVFAYRAHVDRAMKDLLGTDISYNLESVITVGLHHEMQHQELMLMDLKHVFSVNPLKPVYRSGIQAERSDAPAMNWLEFDGGLRTIGFEGEGFSFDNEHPGHQVYLEPFAIADRPVTNGEFIEFIEAGGYQQPEFWLSDGWKWVQENGIMSPLYWEKGENGWRYFTLGGMRDVNPAEPVCHVSHYEADAFASWKGARLPLESEWEVAVQGRGISGNFVESGRFHPAPVAGDALFGDVWEWTSSPYMPYPGYRKPEGAIGEYNGKFMSGQMVLRGGCCVTPERHIRPTYRNFFPPHSRWLFSGFRLAKDRA